MPSSTTLASPNRAFTLSDIEAAAAVVHDLIPPTPQYRWPLLADRTGADVWVKHENHTPVGAFKVRGGIVYLDRLRAAGAKVAGVVAATRGNHGQAVAFAASRSGIPTVVVVPHGNSEGKNAAMRAWGADLIIDGHDFQASVEVADALATKRGWHRVPSFHPMLVLGAATYALELFRAAPPLDAVYVSIGLGSGICGVMAARDALGLDTEVIGVGSTAAPAYARSFELGRPVSRDATTRIADGMACRTPVPEAVELIRKGAARIVEVTDDEIESAMRAMFDDTHNVAEGSGAAGLAALMQERDTMRGRRVGVILSGGNVDAAVFGRVLAAGAG